MQYLEYVKLGIAGLSLLIDLIKDLKGDATDSDTTIDKGAAFLGNLGEVAKIKELKGVDLSGVLPDLKQLVAKIAELKKAQTPEQPQA